MNRSRSLIWLALALLALALPAPATAQRDVPTAPDTILQAKLDSLVAGFHGRVGVYVRHLPSGRTAEINADELFPTASMIKVAILAAVFDRIERDELDFFQKLTYTDSLLYPGEDILGSFADSATIPLAQVLLLMITTSDNTAALWAQHLAGTGTHINQWLEANDFTRTRVNSRTPGREDDREIYGWGQTTPREMAELLVMIREGRAVSPAASEAMYRHLTRIYWTGTALAQIPPWVQAASKQGAVSQSRSEVVLVNAPSGDYVFCVITKDQEDTSWSRDNEGFELLRNLSATLWNYFEPDSPWKPAPGVERYEP
ncbi:MAG: class A beta-lactamase-related serine hydrolase [Gemmatimonadales bacterium]|jgi:beta-lactamase class A